jgi:very-short-patch-repair endonuclease
MSRLEASLALQIQGVRLPEPKREHRFHPVRKWRFDFAWPAQMLAVEIEGGLFVAGRHSRGLGQLADMEKVATAMLMGWRVLRVGDKHVKSGAALGWIAALLEMK